MKFSRFALALVVSTVGTTADPSMQTPLADTAVVSAGGTRFRVHTISDELKSGYQVIAVDLTGDGRKDLIALTEGMQELVWFEAPNWARHVMVDGVRNMSAMAAHDIDDDGVPELALGYFFSGRPVAQPGLVAILRHDGDPRARWTLTEIDQVPTVHRCDGSTRTAPAVRCCSMDPWSIRTSQR